MKNAMQTTRNYDLFDVFDDFFKPMFFEESQKGLKTDIRETETDYLLDLALPGYAKEEIKVSLENGYLTVSAAKEKHEEGEKYLLREIAERVSRSFYVGGEITRDQVKAKYENGILSLTVPKAPAKKAPEDRFIAID